MTDYISGGPIFSVEDLVLSMEASKCLRASEVDILIKLTLGNPNLFKELSQDQAQAAREALSLPYDTQNNTTGRRTFNYDIAKML